MKETGKPNNSFSLPELLNRYDKLKEEVKQLKSTLLNKAKLDAYFYESPIPLISIDSEHKIIFANRLFLDIVGETSETITGKSLNQFLTDEPAKERLNENINKLFSGKTKIVKEKLLISSEQEKRKMLEIRARLVEYDDDIGKAVHIIFQDVSEEVQFREAYCNLVENSLQAIFILQDFKIVFANQKAAELSGYSVNELRELNFNGVKHLVHQEDRSRMFGVLRESMSGKRILPKQEFRCVRKDGSVYWIEVIASFLDYNGKPALQLVQLDISEKKIAETQASSFELKYITLVEQSIIGVYIITYGLFSYVNPRFASIFGFTPDEMMNKISPQDIVYPEDWPIVKENLRKRIDGEIQSLHYEFRGITKKGRVIYVEVHGSRTEVDGVPSVIGMLQDVTERKETEEKLHLQSTALSSAANSIVITDINGNIVYTNPAFTKLTGYSFDEVIDKKTSILKSRKHDKQFYQNIWDTILNGKVWDGEIVNKRKDGSLYIEKQTITPVPGEQSDIEYFIAIKSDITESKKIERALKESEQKLRNIIEHSNEMFYIHDANHVLKYISPQSKDILGYTPNEIMVEWTSLVTDNPINEKGYQLTEKAIETGEAQEEYLLEMIKKDGKKIYAQVAESPIKDAFGNVIGIAGAIRDVTEKIEAEKVLKESEERFRGLYENATLGIYRTTPAGEVLMANPALIKLLGYSSFDEVKSIDAQSILYDKPETRDYFQKVISEKEEVYGFETTAKKKDGTKFFIRESARAIKDSDGNTQYFEGIVEDISSQKEAEQKLIEAKEAAEKSDLLKSEFLAQMSHEIRTPINVIQSFAGLIREEVRGLISSELLNSFSIIDNASRRMIRTIDLILNMSQLQTGSYSAKKIELDIYQEVLMQLYPELSRLAKEKDLILEISKPDKLPQIFADEYSVRQIFDNLVHNAIKYTQNGKVSVTLENNSQGLVVEVVDTGVGISEEYLPNLFKPFTQEEHGYTRKYEGNGLGLALVKRYCDLNNIKIDVESEKHVGTKFILCFPIAKD